MLNTDENTTTSRHHSQLTALAAKSCPLFSNEGRSTKMRKFKIFQWGTQRVWRHYQPARFNITFSDNNETQQIVAKNGEKIFQILQIVDFDKEAERICLIYVVGNNIYWREDVLSDDPSKDIQITSDGVPDVVFNGMGDWVYQEEVLETDSAFYFNKREEKLAYVQINGSKVSDFQFPMYGGIDQIHSNKYPKYM